ncbi:MAG: hypothetical protein KIH08_14850 [Candidatus Freyarchaeota archaeon]|nr:hypothetical protein [Candidatus Jordarchaeia archaeon]MBS7270530.1 hypothetical protein [Candidatus Jordarchaeia archaeon]
MKTKTVYYFIVFIVLLLMGVFLASSIKYVLLLHAGPLVFLYPALVRFTPLGFYVEILYLDSFPYPFWFLVGYRPPLVVPVDSQYYGIFYTGVIAIILAAIVLSIPAGLILPLLGMPEYEHFHDAWARVKFLVTKSSWKKRLTISFTIIVRIIGALIVLIMYSILFQIIPLTYTEFSILLLIVAGWVIILSTILPKKRLTQLYEQD